MKLVTVFDTKTRPDTAGVYVDRALAELGHEVVHLEPRGSAGDLEGVAGVILVDDGIDYHLDLPIPTAYWAIDTHLTMEQCVKKGKSSTYVFTAQKSGAEELAKKLGKPVKWLPLGCDREVHTYEYTCSGYRSVEGIKEYDVCFVGNVYPVTHKHRVEFLDRMFKEFPNFFYGQRDPKTASEIYAKSRVVLNCSVSGDVNMRVFEALASGSPLLTDYIEDIKTIGLGDKCLMYKSLDEAVEMAKTAIKENTPIGKEEVLARHTYKDRVSVILSYLKGETKCL